MSQKRYKIRAKKKGKTKCYKKNQIKNRRKDNKMLSQKREKGAWKKTRQKAIKGWNRRSRFWHINC
jgi:hypothetical protein